MNDVNSANHAQNTITTYETQGGETIRLTLNFALLYKAKAEHPVAYKHYNTVMMGGVKDIFDQVTIMYMAYLCANSGTAMTYEEFMAMLGDDTAGVASTAIALLGRKKKSGFRDPFIRHTHRGRNRIKPPRFVLEDIEDYYTLYVLILGVPENVFWNCDIAFVFNVADNKSAYEKWLDSAKEMVQRSMRKKR